MKHQSDKIENFIFYKSNQIAQMPVDLIKTHSTIACQKSGRPAGRPVAGKVPCRLLSAQIETIVANFRS